MKAIDTKFTTDLINREDIKNDHNKLEEVITDFSSQVGMAVNKLYKYSPLSFLGIIGIVVANIIHTSIGIRTSVRIVENGVNYIGETVDSIKDSYAKIEKLVVKTGKNISDSYSHDMEDVNKMLDLKDRYIKRVNEIVDNMHMYEGLYNRLILCNVEELILQRDPSKLIKFCDNVLYFNDQNIKECHHTTLMIYKHMHLIENNGFEEIMDISTFHKFLRLNNLDTKWRDYTKDEMGPYKGIDMYYNEFPDLNQNKNPIFDYFKPVENMNDNTEDEKEEKEENEEQGKLEQEEEEEQEEQQKIEQIEEGVSESWWVRKYHGVKNYLSSFFHDNNNYALEAENNNNNTTNIDTFNNNFNNNDNFYDDFTNNYNQSIGYNNSYIDGTLYPNQTNLLGNSTTTNDMIGDATPLLITAATIGLAALGRRMLGNRQNRPNRPNVQNRQNRPNRQDDTSDLPTKMPKNDSNNNETANVNNDRIHVLTDKERERDNHINELTKRFKQESDIENQNDKK